MVELSAEAQTAGRRTLARLDLEQLTDAVVAGAWEPFEFGSVAPPRDEVRAAVRWNLDLAIQWLLNGQQLAGDEMKWIGELAREMAAAGQPLDRIPARYRRGVRVAWHAVLETASEEDRMALIEGADLLFEYVDSVSSAFGNAYEEAARDSSSLQEQRAQALFERLRSARELTARDRELAAEIGFQPDAASRAFLVGATSRRRPQQIAIAGRLRQLGVLAVVGGSQVIGLAPGPLPWRELDLPPEAIVAEGELARLDQIDATLEELRVVVEIATLRGRKGVVQADEFLLDLLLRGSPTIAARLVARVYGPLPDELARTLDVLIENDFDRTRAAEQIPVHRNTLRNRLVRVEELTGLQLDPEGRALVSLAWVQRRTSAARVDAVRGSVRGQAALLTTT